MEFYQFVLFFVHLVSTVIHLTNGLICLKWTLLNNKLILTCNIDNLDLTVTFLNPNKEEHGHCFIPTSTSACVTSYPNVNITQDLSKNETSLIVTIDNNTNLDGIWTCAHGIENERATAVVQMLKSVIKDQPVTDVSTVNIYASKYLKLNHSSTIECAIHMSVVNDLRGVNITFLVNNTHYATLHKNEFRCLLLPSKEVCRGNKCYCVKKQNRYRYGITHEGISHAGGLKFGCHIQLNLKEHYSDCILARVIDMKGPKISTNIELPVSNGTAVVFLCYAEVNNYIVYLLWHCLNASLDITNITNHNRYTLTANAVVTSENDGQHCHCSVLKDDDMLASTSITLLTTKTPVIVRSKDLVCKETHAVTLTCSIANLNDFSSYGFTTWTHIQNGKFVKHLVGIVSRDVSLLYLWNCNTADDGYYICTAWGQYMSKREWANDTIQILVEGKEKILNTTNENTTYIVAGTLVLVFILLILSVLKKKCLSRLSNTEPIIYHAAPAEQIQENVYMSPESHYAEIGEEEMQFEVLNDNDYAETDKSDDGSFQNESRNDYLDVY